MKQHELNSHQHPALLVCKPLHFLKTVKQRVLVGLFALVATVASPALTHADFSIFEFTGNTETFVVPGGVSSLNVLVLGGGGGGANGHQGGGGAGFLTINTLSVTPGDTFNIDVGMGGSGADQSNNNNINGLTAGTGSSFGTVTAGGGQVVTGVNQGGQNGSSGGGASASPGGPGGAGGSGGSNGSFAAQNTKPRGVRPG